MMTDEIITDENGEIVAAVVHGYKIPIKQYLEEEEKLSLEQRKERAIFLELISQTLLRPYLSMTLDDLRGATGLFSVPSLYREDPKEFAHMEAYERKLRARFPKDCDDFDEDFTKNISEPTN
jgi:hypothetical protein